MKEQEKSPEKELNEMKASKLPDTEFKTMVRRIFQEIRELQHHERIWKP